jgi:benzoylformate decarboxylase
MGVDALRVEKPEEIGPAIDRMLADDKPFLIDLVIKGDINPDLVNKICGQ